MMTNNTTDFSTTTGSTTIANSVVTGSAGVLIPRYSGFTSAICSLLIIYVILLSRNRLSTTYHRILFYMSIFDVVSSVSIALTTLPMPSDDPVVNSYGFQGTRLGNIETCKLQGFFILFGAGVTFAYNLSLTIYYVCILGCEMTFETMSKKVEPFLHLFSITILNITYTIPNYFLDLYFPSQTTTWCAARPIPNGRGSTKLNRTLNLVAASFIIIDLLVTMGCLAFVYVKVRKHYQNSLNDHSTHTNIRNEEEQRASDLARSERYKTETKLLLIQCLCYVIALLITGFFTLYAVAIEANPKLGSRVMFIMMFTFRPLQGFFNFLIFIGSKIIVLRRADTNISFCGAMKTLFWKSRSDCPFIFTDLSNVVIAHNIPNEEVQVPSLIGLLERQEFSIPEISNVSLGRIRAAEPSPFFREGTITRDQVDDQNESMEVGENVSEVDSINSMNLSSRVDLDSLSNAFSSRVDLDSNEENGSF